MKWICALSVLLAACSSSVFSREEAALWSSDGAFRFLARDMYVEFFDARCGAARNGNRSSSLAAESFRLKAFEQRLRPRIRTEILIAREDAAYEHEVDGACYHDPDPESRKRRLTETRGQIAYRLGQLQRIATRVKVSRPAPTLGMTRGAEFRYLVRNLERQIGQGCRISDKAENDEVLAPARVEVVRFRERLQGTPFAAHHAVAESDAAFENRIFVGECDAQRREPLSDLQQEYLSRATAQISAIEALIRAGR